MILDIIIWAFTIYFCIQLGAYLQRLRDELGEEVDDDPDKEASITAIVEYHEGTMYAWESEHQDFLGQGKTLDQLEEHIQKRCRELYTRDVRVRMTTEDPTLIKNFSARNT